MWSLESSNNGTGLLKFKAVIGSEKIVKHGRFKTMTTVSQCITMMKDYQDRSLEELRLEDYAANRKGLLLPLGASSNSRSFDPATTSTCQVGTPASLFGTPSTRSVGPFGDTVHGNQPYFSLKTGKRTRACLQNTSAFGFENNPSQNGQTTADMGKSVFRDSSQPTAMFDATAGRLDFSFVNQNTSVFRNNVQPATPTSTASSSPLFNLARSKSNSFETNGNNSTITNLNTGMGAGLMSNNNPVFGAPNNHTFGQIGNSQAEVIPSLFGSSATTSGPNFNTTLSSNNHSTNTFPASSTFKTSTGLNFGGFGNNHVTNNVQDSTSSLVESESKSGSSYMGKQFLGTVTVPVSSGQAFPLRHSTSHTFGLPILPNNSLFGNNGSLSTPMSISETNIIAGNTSNPGVGGRSVRLESVESKQTSAGLFSIYRDNSSNGDVEMSN